MNFDHIGKQLGKTLRVFPRPILRQRGRPPVPWDSELTLSQVNKGEGWIELHNPATGHVVKLFGDNLKGFTRPDLLELRQQLVVTETGVKVEPVAAGGVDAASAAAGAVQDLVARATRLRQALIALPQPGSEPRAARLLRDAPLWSALELEGFTSAANRLDTTTAATAAKIITNLRYLEDRVREVCSASGSLLGYNFERFPWNMWHFNWSEADTALAKLLDASGGARFAADAGGEYHRPTPDVTSDRTTPPPTPERVTIREKSAAEILGNLKEITLSSRFREKVEQLYFGRWTREPGWQATVHSLPSKLSGGRWFCSFKEVGSGAYVMASTVQDVSALRPGDSVTVSGRINDVTQGEFVTLEDAIVRGDNVPFP